ncbi:hypothetical protein I79_014255 [Cricetulus griseus]|uniref:Uncharacterized protein n=1 Tax=Cricetulus griseus TaxID=10029 RepID=G3HTM7_CRIGR|nr:hypothetical protein I79_014255 [Cricetulus griseus]
MFSELSVSLHYQDFYKEERVSGSFDHSGELVLVKSFAASVDSRKPGSHKCHTYMLSS